jgi:hypothetical protein
MIDSDKMKYKRKIMSLLVQNPNIVTLINAQDISKPDDLIDTHIFSYLDFPDVPTIVDTYIAMKLDTTKVMKNEVYKNFILTICVIVHKSKMETNYGGNLTNVISGEIIQMLNWNDNFGFTLELVSDREFIHEKTYHVEELVFKTITPNSMQNGMRING